MGSPKQPLWIVPSGLPTQYWSPNMRDFWITRQEETLALAWALQCYTERSGMLPSVLCDAAWDLQRCMVPLMHLEEDEIVEVSLLRPVSKGPGTSPNLEEEAVLLGTEPTSQRSQETAMLPCKCQEETPKPEDTVKQSDTPCTPAPLAMAPRTRGNQSCTSRGTWSRPSASQDPVDDPNDWVLAYIMERDELPSWWPEFQSPLP